MNRAEIMKRAWQIKKEDSRYIFGLCLKMAWAEAKEGKKEIMTQREKDEKEAINQASAYCGHVKLHENRWQQYGKDRTYVEARVYTNAWNLKRVIKAGYQDNLTGEWFTDKNLY